MIDLSLRAESGETMKAAGLKAIDTVIESTAVLVKSRNTKNKLVDLIASRIRGVISMFISLLPVLRMFVHIAKSYQLPRNMFFASITSLAHSFPP